MVKGGAPIYWSAPSGCNSEAWRAIHEVERGRLSEERHG